MLKLWHMNTPGTPDVSWVWWVNLRADPPQDVTVSLGLELHGTHYGLTTNLRREQWSRGLIFFSNTVLSNKQTNKKQNNLHAKLHQPSAVRIQLHALDRLDSGTPVKLGATIQRWDFQTDCCCFASAFLCVFILINPFDLYIFVPCTCTRYE